MYLIMLYPLIFVMGWLPHARTFVMTLLEQFNIHIFGGTGCVSIWGTFIVFMADILSTGILVGIGYYSAIPSRVRYGYDYISGLYGGAVVGLSYLLSRMPSNPTFYLKPFKQLYNLIKGIKVQGIVKIRQQEYEENLLGVDPKRRYDTLDY